MVNTLNFCSFTVGPKSDTGTLVAYPGVHDGQVIVTSLPSEERVATVPPPKDVKTGMVMAIRLTYVENQLKVLVGYESGHACVWQRNKSSDYWERTYTYKAHSQPILSLDVAPTLNSFWTSSADAILARHPLVEGTSETKMVQTRHAGQQAVTVRSDEKIFATAGWDGRVRVYSAKAMKELAVLKWHKEGCYALAFADLMVGSTSHQDSEAEGAVVRRELTVSEQRTQKAKSTHWLAAGSKDGKISMWDIY